MTLDVQFPTPATRRTGVPARISRSLFHLRGADLSPITLSGHLHVNTLSDNNAITADSNGALFRITNGNRFSARDLDGDNVRERTGLWLELATTNLCVRSEDFTAWSASGATVTANATTAPDGLITADLIARASSGADGLFNVAAFTGNGTKSCGFFLKAGTSPVSSILIFDATTATARHIVNVTWSGGVPTLSTSSGSGTLFPPELHANGFWRCGFTATGVVAANTNLIGIVPSPTGVATENVYAWGANAGNSAFWPSYVTTAAIAATKAGEAADFSTLGSNQIDFPCQTMAGLHRFVELGGVTVASGAHFSISNDAATGVRLWLDSSGSFYRLNYNNGTATATATLAAAPTYGQQVDLWWQLSATGALSLSQSIASGGTTTATAAAPSGGLVTAWGTTPLIRLNQHGTANFGASWRYKDRIVPGTATRADLLVGF